MYKFFVFFVLIIVSSNAHAGRGIPSPYVDKGKSVVTTDGLFVTSGSHDTRFRFTYDYGLTDQIGLRFRSTHDDFSDHSANLTRTELAIKYEIAEKGVLPIDLGLYFDYFKNYGSDISDNAQIRFLFAKDLDEWTHGGNVILNKRFGEGLGETTIAIRLRSHYKYDSLNKIGLEYFGNFGDFSEDRFQVIDDNSHSFGPNWQHKIEDTALKVEFGAIFGVTRSAEPVTLKWKFSYSF